MESGVPRDPGAGKAAWRPDGPVSGRNPGLDFLISLRLTIVLLVLSIILVFVATLDQVHLGVWAVQEKYFQSFFVFVRVPGTAVAYPVFPGGYLLGGVLILNLVAGHLWRFKFYWGKSGIWLTHLGLILLLLGEGISGMMQKDCHMRIDVGGSSRYAESFRDYELAVTDATDPNFDEVVSIPAALLGKEAPIQNPKLPFVVRPVAYYANATLARRGQSPDAPGAPAATMGFNTGTIALPAPVATGADGDNWPAAYVELKGTEGPLGIVLVSAMQQQPQPLAYRGRSFRLALRPRRDYLPFTLTLLKFTHDVYPGTDIPKDFASTVRLRSDDGRDDRQVRIYMNNPLRYAGRAIYQAGYENNDHTTVLEVVRNPGWRIPYVSCALIAFGLAVQFCIHLLAFFRRRAAEAARPAAGAPQ